MNNSFQFGKQKQEQLLAQFSKGVTPSQLKEQIIEKGFDVYTKQDISKFITDAKEKNVLEKAISQVNELVPVIVKINAEQSGTVFVSNTPSAIEKAFDTELNELSLDIIKGGARVPVGTIVVRKNGVKEMKTETGWKYMGKDKKGKSEGGDSKEKTEKHEDISNLPNGSVVKVEGLGTFTKKDDNLWKSPGGALNDSALKKKIGDKKVEITNKFGEKTEGKSKPEKTESSDKELDSMRKFAKESTDEKLEEIIANSKNEKAVQVAKKELESRKEKNKEVDSKTKVKEKKQPRVLSKLEPFLKEEGDRNLRMTNWHIGGVVGTISSIFEDYDKSLVDFKEEAIKFFEKKAPNARRDVEDHLNRGAVSNVSPNDFVELYGIFQKHKDKMPENWQNRFETKFRKGFNSMLEDAEKGKLTKKPKEEEKPQPKPKKTYSDDEVLNRLSTWMRDMDEDDMKDVYTGVVPKNKVNAAADGSYSLTPEEDKKLIDKYRKIFSED